MGLSILKKNNVTASAEGAHAAGRDIINNYYAVQLNAKAPNSLRFKVWITYDSSSAQTCRLYESLSKQIKKTYEHSEIISCPLSTELYAEQYQPIFYNTKEQRNQILKNGEEYIYSISILDNIDSYLVASMLSEDKDLAPNSMVFIHNSKNTGDSFFNTRTKLMLEKFQGIFMEYSKFEEVYKTVFNYLDKKLTKNLQRYKDSGMLSIKDWIFIYLFLESSSISELKEHCKGLSDEGSFDEVFKELKSKEYILTVMKGSKKYKLAENYIANIKEFNQPLYLAAENTKMHIQSISK